MLKRHKELINNLYKKLAKLQKKLKVMQAKVNSPSTLDNDQESVVRVTNQSTVDDKSY